MISHLTFISGQSKDSVNIPHTFTNQAMIVLTCLITEGTSFTVYSLSSHSKLLMPLFVHYLRFPQRGDTCSLESLLKLYLPSSNLLFPTIFTEFPSVAEISTGRSF